MFDQMLKEISNKNFAGELKVGEALINRYYRLLDGKHAGRVIIKCYDRIDGRQIIRFANGLTWAYLDDMSDMRCECTYPTFSAPVNVVDYSQATWYDDNSEGPRHHTW